MTCFEITSHNAVLLISTVTVYLRSVEVDDKPIEFDINRQLYIGILMLYRLININRILTGNFTDINIVTLILTVTVTGPIESNPSIGSLGTIEKSDEVSNSGINK